MSDRDPFEELERAFDTLSGEFGVDLGSIPTDVIDEGDAFVVRADLPGFDSAEIDVQLAEDRKLTVSADHSESTEQAEGTYVKRERRRRSASRTVSLPSAVDEGDTSATYENGVLTVRLPKADAEDGGTDIPVN